MITRLGLVSLAAVMLAGCVLFDGSRRSGPDEFGVVARAPLSQPPDYALRPPRTGAERPNEVSPRDQARDQLLQASTSASSSGANVAAVGAGAAAANGAAGASGAAEADSFSRGEEALLREAGAVGVDPNIRVTIDRESGRVVEDESLVESLVFWGKDEKPTEKVLDPATESERLKRNAALGVPAAGNPDAATSAESTPETDGTKK
ncbi:MAG: DUF3035 domain-containing protein [Pseudomonadota bacterium]